MRGRITGRIITVVFTVLFAVLAIIYIFDTDDGEMYHGFQAISFSVLSLTAATFYRYFED